MVENLKAIEGYGDMYDFIHVFKFCMYLRRERWIE